MLFSYLFTSLLVHLLTYLSTPSRIDPFCFQAGGRRRRPKLVLVFVLILCRSIFCYGRMFAFVVFVSVFRYLAKRLAGKNISEMTYFCVEWNVKP